MGRTGRSMAAELAWPQIVSSSSGIRKLEQGVHVGLFQELRRKCRTFSGTVARVFINSDSARWESFEINRPFFTYSGNLHCCPPPGWDSAGAAGASPNRLEVVPGAGSGPAEAGGCVDGTGAGVEVGDFAFRLSSALRFASSWAALAAASISALAWASVLPTR